MTRLDALKALAEKVEAGAVVSEQDTTELWPMLGGEWQLCRNAALAANGSLDAAKALHEAVLPRWGFKVCPQYALVIDPENIYGRTRFDRDAVQTENPARAWLLAILRALIAQEAAE